MRFGLVLAAVVLANSAAADDRALSGIKGPAANAIRQYLKETPSDCPADSKDMCTQASVLTRANVVYGHFPGEQRMFAVAFLESHRARHRVELTVEIWTEESPQRFQFFGETAAIGEHPRAVRFLPGRIIGYRATVLRGGDSNAGPTDQRQFRLAVTSNSVSFLDR